MTALLTHLVDIGVVPAFEADVAVTPVDVLMERYTRYLLEERGLSMSSIRCYVEVAHAFLSWFPAGRELELEGLTTATVTEFVLAQCRRCKVASAKAMTTRLRSLLRFFYLEGLTPTALAPAVPTVACWRQGSLPKALAASDVARLLKSCDRRTSVGRRDFAVLVVLSRLGLRAGEVAGLRFGDIDWRQGDLVVRGKANRHDRLPVPGDVGEAIVGWLQRGRPRCGCQSVFTRVRAPHRALSSGGISVIVWHACERAGLPPVGAHRLRHTAATQMLRAGGSLTEVGQVLRHLCDDTTSIYAKVDRRSLNTVVAPWPGGAQ
jgi:site-specific recombinase XerD